jgi:hypothetical protein
MHALIEGIDNQVVFVPCHTGPSIREEVGRNVCRLVHDLLQLLNCSTIFHNPTDLGRL